MNKRVNLFVCILVAMIGLVLCFSFQSSFAQSEQPAAAQAHLVWQLPGDANAYKDVPFAPGEILVGFHQDQARAAALLTTMDVQFVEAVDLRGLDGAEGNAGIDGQLLRVPTGREWEAIAELQKNSAVAFAVPNWLVQAADLTATEMAAQPETPFNVNDPCYAERAASASDPCRGVAQWYLQRINASRAWALAYDTEGFSGQLSTIRVATVDSGIDFAHPELKDHILAGYNYLTAGTTKPNDDYGHGTHVAGLIAATINNASGIAGVAPAVEFIPYKVLNSAGTGTIANVAAAIRAAADNKARIINMSLETASPNVVMEAAVKYAYGKGALLVAASGNSYPQPVAWPAAYEQVVAVASTTYSNRHASYSSAGTQVALAAPGGDTSNSILSTWPGSVYCRDIKAALPQSGYCTSEGTSMAAAVVSGAAALVMSVRPDLSGDQVRQLLVDTAAPVIGEDATRVGSGLLDIHTALRALLPSSLRLLAPDNITRNLALGAAPYTVTLRIENPSLEPLTWRSTLIGNDNWVSVQHAISGTISGTVRYGEPAHIALTITPTQLITGGYITNLQVIGTRADKSTVTQTAGISLYVGVTPHLNYLPLAFQNATFTNDSSVSAYHWEIPANPNTRTIHNLPDNDKVDVTLPFTFTMRNKAYTDIQVFSDGYVVLGAGAGLTTKNICLPNISNPQEAIYGWWADLDPSLPGASVSTFRPATDRFVIEYSNVSSAVTITPSYQVSFQIVLYTNGNIRLNYQQAPGTQNNPPLVTIGVEAVDGRFHNQVVCKDNATELGTLPDVNQSILFNPQKDVY